MYKPGVAKQTFFCSLLHRGEWGLGLGNANCPSPRLPYRFFHTFTVLQRCSGCRDQGSRETNLFARRILVGPAFAQRVGGEL